MITLNAMLGVCLVVILLFLALSAVLKLRCKLLNMKKDKESFFLMLISISEDLEELSQRVECSTLEGINRRVQLLETILHSDINPNSAKRAADPLGVSNSDS